MSEAHLERGVPIDNDLVRAQSFTASYAYEAVSGLLGGRKRPTAVVAGGISMLTGILRAVSTEKLRIPEDISVVGCGDFDLAELTTPPMTVIRWKYDAIGEAAAHMVIDRIARPDPHAAQTEISHRTDSARIMWSPAVIAVRQSSCASESIRSRVRWAEWMWARAAASARSGSRALMASTMATCSSIAFRRRSGSENDVLLRSAMEFGQDAERLGQISVVRHHADRSVKAPVVRGHFLGAVGQLPFPPGHVDEHFQLRRRGELRRHARGCALKYIADDEQLHHHLIVELGDGQAFMRPMNQQSLVFQATQRFADRRSADLEPAGDILLKDPLAGHEGTLLNCLANLLINRITQAGLGGRCG